MAEPIWKDEVLRWANLNGTTQLSISADGEVVYQCKLTSPPGSKEMSMNINHIVKDYLSSKINFNRLTRIYQQPMFKRTFELSAFTQNGVRTVTRYNDWSYESRQPSDYCESLSSPLSNIVDPRQILFSTIAKVGDGEAGECYLDYCDKGMCLRPLYAIPSPCVTFAYPLKDVSENVKIDILHDREDAAITYQVKKTCADYCLYYLNAYGGYDHLLIKGTVLRTDSYARTEITKDVSNATLSHGKQCITTDITPKWRLNTDYLTDEQWAKTHHLLGSTHVLLHNLATDEIIPVVITSSAAEFKTYRNQGNKKSFLTIDVEASVKRMRK
jgi:hypothetical protein